MGYWEEKRDKNFLIKFVFWLDKKTDLLGRLERNRAKWLLENFPISSWIETTDMTLDIGCGIGDISFLLSQKGKNIFSIDIVDFRRKEIKNEGNFTFLAGDAHFLPFKNSVFNNILILVTLHHLQNPEDVITQALRVLKKGGKLIVLEDIVGPQGSYLRFITLFIDNIINLSIKGNPNTNKMEQEWIELFENKHKLEKINSYTLKWGPLFKSLKLGIFIYRK